MNAFRAQGRGRPVVLIAAAALSGVIGVGAAVAVVVTSDGVHGGKATPTQIAESLVDAWAAGDGDRAVALMPSYDELTAALDCPRIEEKHGRKHHTHARTEVWARARVWQARRPKLRQVAPGVLTERGVDEELGRCRTVTPFAMQPITVSVELDGGGHGQYDVEMTAVRLDGRWYLMNAGELPTERLESESRELVAEREARRELRERKKRPRRGYDYDEHSDDDDSDDAQDKSVWAAIGGPSSAVLAKFRGFRDTACACKDIACLDQSNREMEAFDKDYDASAASDDEHRAVQALLEERTSCVLKLRSEMGPSTGVPACDEYVRYIEWYMSCDKIPQSARDSMKQGLDAMRAAWTDAASMPDAARQAMSDGCQSGVDALKQAGDVMGCGTAP